jgi:DNA-binding transcriptional ArsR family regulator
MKLSHQSPQLDLAFEALGNAKRRAIMHALSFGPATVSQLAGEFALSLPAIHKHMRLLEVAGLIQRRKVGRVNFVALRRTGLAEVQAWIMQYRTEWGSDNETLDNYIASLSSTS